MQKEETTGDHQEFDEMYRRTQAEIYKFIRYRVADKELAKDVLQETYYVAYKKWDILCEHSNPMGWLINTAKNKIRELNKSLKKIECEVGLDAAQAREVLASDAYADEVREREAFYQSQGIHSVPAVIINDRHLISGGQPAEVFEQALRQAALSGVAARFFPTALPVLA